MLHNITTYNIRVPHGLRVRFAFNLLNGDYSNSIARLVIKNSRKKNFYDSDGRGEVFFDGSTLVIDIPWSSSGYGGIRSSDNSDGYSYGLTIDGAWRIQGSWESVPDTGCVSGVSNEHNVIVGSPIINVSVVNGGGGYCRVSDVDLPPGPQLKGVMRYRETTNSSIWERCCKVGVDMWEWSLECTTFW